MKTIPNKSTALPLDQTGSKMATFADLLGTALNFAPQGGFDPKTLRARARVEAALEGAGPGDDIKLEDADYETARAALSACRWNGRAKDIIALLDAFGVE